MERQCGGLIVSMKDSFYLRGEETHRGSSGKGSSSMKLNKKATALLLGLTLGISGTAFAADGADSFSDVPQGHWAYDALDYLAKDGVIDGMGDGTFQGNRTMTRYEMASIVAKAMQKGGLGVGDQAVLEKLEKEYGAELATLKNQVNQNTKDINDLKNGVAGKLKLDGMIRVQYDADHANGNYAANKDLVYEGSDSKSNHRFYFNLNAAYKVNDNWTAKTQLEKNANYAHTGQYYYDGKENGYEYDKAAAYDKGNRYKKTWSGHNGEIQRIWVEGYNPHSGGWISIGRAWRGLGAQNMFMGNESDGVQAGVPIKGSHLTASLFYMTPSVGDYATPWYYGAGVWGNIGHNVGINFDYAHRYNGPTDWGIENGYVLSGWWNMVKNVEFKVDYTKTDADNQNHGIYYRLNYRNTNLAQPKSYQLYARYFYKGNSSHLHGDDEWGSIDINGNVKGWMFGVKYVPWTNVEWETMYSRQAEITNSDNTRNLFRTQMDFHF